ncbi:FtsH protease activity modulator HflK [Alkalicaulis satelles]|uniref:Protein HflK n=1 Tax=Alkalicaulis satelles TaxID=2609175 RepID=A0A5M6ZIG9_9PROT|nr:FtsH protease activity modulator HflK [Alkalicaulis satelles]KAA5804623.1 FtsH protease activity modulator HflK [Alkalicaulis satelles]
MPWNNNTGGGGGPWGSAGGGGGNNNPWGGRGQNGPGRRPEPDMEDAVRKFQDWLGGLFGGRGGGSGGLAGLLIVAALFVWVAVPGNFYYFVGAEQRGVVLRFGEYNRTELPGLRLKMPFPVETVELPAVTTVNEVVVGRTPQESLMLTRDENIVDITFTVQWRVDLAYPEGVRDFLFNVRDPEGMVKAVAESAMREVVGTNDLQPIITQARAEVGRRARDILQTTLNNYTAGIQILEVQLQDATPPATVIDAFRDVDAARQDRARLELEARAYANRIIPEARGEAARIDEQARGYRERVIAEADGQADRFNSIFAEYQQARDVTRRRMFLETMEQVLGRSELIILEQDGGAVPYLPLDRLGQNRGRAPQSSAVQSRGNQGGQ